MKRKKIIILISAIIALVGFVALGEAAAKNGVISPDECENPIIRGTVATSVYAHSNTIRENGIEEAKVKIEAELKRLEAERLEAERIAAEKAKLNYTRPIINPNSSIPGDKYIALTFDDGPGPHTGRLLDLLNSHGVKATFFVVGKNIDKNPGVLNRMVNEGHQIGGHSWNHPQLTTLGEAGVTSQIMDTRNKIVSVTGVDTALVRPPYGSIDGYTKNIAANLGCSYINWSVDSLDWKSRNVDAIYYEIMTAVKDGSIILCHDIHGTTVDAMEIVIPDLLAQGYHLVTVTELLGTTTPGMVYYSR